MFEVSRVVAADFDAWVARVDVAAGISLMADYLGGRRVAVGEDPARDAAGRAQPLPPAAQLPRRLGWGAHRRLQDRARRAGPDRHRLLWRTVHSPNGSAVHDDGTLTFDGWRCRTAVPAPGSTIRGRQLFTLPPVLDAADLPALPELHGPLLEEAYRRFFTTTFDNLEACFEGREFRIGRPPPDPTEPLLTESVRMLVDGLTSRPGGDEGAARGTPARGGPRPGPRRARLPSRQGAPVKAR